MGDSPSLTVSILVDWTRPLLHTAHCGRATPASPDGVSRPGLLALLPSCCPAAGATRPCGPLRSTVHRSPLLGFWHRRSSWAMQLLVPLPTCLIWEEDSSRVSPPDVFISLVLLCSVDRPATTSPLNRSRGHPGGL